MGLAVGLRPRRFKLSDFIKPDHRRELLEIEHQQDDSHLTTFEGAIAEFPEVMECYLMTGDADYQLRVVVESLYAFEEFLRSRLTRISGVAQVTTSFALRPVVYKTALPVKADRPTN